MTYYLPIGIGFEEDECLYSWEYRTLKKNLYKNRKEFEESFSKGQALHKDSFGLTRLMFISAGFNDLQKRIYEKHSFYPFYAPFYNEQKQEKVLQIQRNGAYFKSPITPITKGIKELKYCPVCANEDSVLYLHRAHQLPGVTCCHKHHCKLITLENDKDGNEMDQIVRGNGPDYRITDEEFDYARFMKAFLDQNFDMNAKDLYKMVEIRVKDLGLKSVEDIKNYFKNQNKEINSRNAKFMLSSVHLLSEEFLQENLKVIFQDIKVLKDIYDKHIKNEKTIDIPQELKDQGYRLIGPYNKNLLEIHHDKCGQSFLITEHGLLNIGLLCPTCQNLTDQELYKKMFYSINDNDFTLLSDFEDNSTNIKVRHSCGHEFEVKPGRFYFDQMGCPKCLSKLTLEDAQKKVDLVDPTWKVLDYKALDKPATFLHTSCNHKVERRFSDFLRKGMSCPHCKLEEKKAKAPDYKQRVYDLVGDEYTVVGEYISDRQPIEIRHNKCGHVQKYARASRFLEGQRCPVCESRVSNEDFKFYVSNKSKGGFEVTDFPNNGSAVIKNVLTNESMELKKPLIIQELARPTESEILVCKDRSNLNKPLSPVGKFLDLIQRHYKDKAFTTEELINKAYTKNEVFRYIRTLKKNNLVSKIGPGVYKLV